MSGDTPVMEKKKGAVKLSSINIRILDDGTYVVRYEMSDYSKSKEYSYQDKNELVKDLLEDLSPLRKKKEENEP